MKSIPDFIKYVVINGATMGIILLGYELIVEATQSADTTLNILGSVVLLYSAWQVYQDWRDEKRGFCSTCGASLTPLASDAADGAPEA